MTRKTVLIETATNTHFALMGEDGQPAGTVCSTAKLPKKFTLRNGGEILGYLVDGTPRYLGVWCHRCNKVDHHGR